jgi:DNA repair protein RecO (recombination protein O)
MAFGHYLLELIHSLTPERDAHEDIFSLLVYCISQLTGTGFREGFIRLFELRLFSLLGYQPQFFRCVSCRQPFSLRATYTFSVRQGGIVCSTCGAGLHDLLPLSNGTIRIFQQAQNLHLPKLSRICFSAAEQEEGKNIFGHFLEYHMGRRPKSLDIIKQFT